MDNTILTAIIAASSAIGSAAIVSYFNSKNNRIVTERELAKEKLAIHAKEKEERRRQFRQDFEKSHILINTLGRAFSLTNLTILWRREISTKEWDELYFSFCEKSDQLRTISSIYDAELYENCSQIYSQMNIFWGNFSNFLYRIEQGDKVDNKTTGYKEAFDAANAISRLTSDAECILQKVNERENQTVRDTA